MDERYVAVCPKMLDQIGDTVRWVWRQSLALNRATVKAVLPQKSRTVTVLLAHLPVSSRSVADRSSALTGCDTHRTLVVQMNLNRAEYAFAFSADCMPRVDTVLFALTNTCTHL